MKKILLTLILSTALLAACKKTGDGTSNTEEKRVVETIAHPKAPTAVGTPRILFIGNSHIDFYISLPQLFSELCAANNIKMDTEELVEMGISIDEIYNTDKNKAEQMFAKTDSDKNYYDYVVIQEKMKEAMILPSPMKVKKPLFRTREKVQTEIPQYKHLMRYCCRITRFACLSSLRTAISSVFFHLPKSSGFFWMIISLKQQKKDL